MRPWKAAVGVGAACAVCCAVPLVGGAAALSVGSATLAAFGSALLACADDLVPLAGALLMLGVVGGGLVWWRRRAARRAAERPAQCLLPAKTAPAKPCGCAPGACG